VHPMHDWRKLYESSPAPSSAVSNSSSDFPDIRAFEI
jgi:hypothetical protein